MKRKYSYIVWRTPFKSYDYQQGDGYFVGYKDKCSDYFSKNWIEASKYVNIGSALNRLGIYLRKDMKCIDDFFLVNKIDDSILRDRKISSIIDVKEDKDIFFEKGHIDKIDMETNTITNAGEDVMCYVMKKIEENNKLIKSTAVANSDYIDTSIPDDDFWNEILK